MQILSVEYLLLKLIVVLYIRNVDLNNGFDIYIYYSLHILIFNL